MSGAGPAVEVEDTGKREARQLVAVGMRATKASTARLGVTVEVVERWTLVIPAGEAQPWGNLRW